jgi:hypothetical protein
MLFSPASGLSLFQYEKAALANPGGCANTDRSGGFVVNPTTST